MIFNKEIVKQVLYNYINKIIAKEKGNLKSPSINFSDMFLDFINDKDPSFLFTENEDVVINKLKNEFELLTNTFATHSVKRYYVQKNSDVYFVVDKEMNEENVFGYLVNSFEVLNTVLTKTTLSTNYKETKLDFNDILILTANNLENKRKAYEYFKNQIYHLEQFFDNKTEIEGAEKA